MNSFFISKGWTCPADQQFSNYMALGPFPLLKAKEDPQRTFIYVIFFHLYLILKIKPEQLNKTLLY